MPLPRSFTGSGDAAFTGEALRGEFDRWSCALVAFGDAALAAFGDAALWACAGNVGLFIFRDVALAGLAGLGETLGLVGL